MESRLTKSKGVLGLPFSPPPPGFGFMVDPEGLTAAQLVRNYGCLFKRLPRTLYNI